MDSIPKQEFRVRDLATRSVTLFPTRAQVVRDIKNITLKPGANEITILGLSPSVDEDSIKVEGTGSAIISDIAVELLPNREIFQEVYPESDQDSSDTDEDDEDEDVTVKDAPALVAVRDKLTALGDEQNRAAEAIASAANRMEYLDSYGNTLDRKWAVAIDVGLDTYRTEREKLFEDHLAGTIRSREITKEIAELSKERQRLETMQAKEDKKAAKAKAKAQKAKKKELEKKRRREAEKEKEKSRIRKERESFWPRSCWSVRITLDALSMSTPGSSRRSSIASASDMAKVVPEKESSSAAGSEGAAYTCDLSLSYVVSSAWWSPSYDLALSTTSNTAVLCFDAQLTNRTSENWTGCKITLSTSQATFSGLQDAIPHLTPWRVRLGGKGHGEFNLLESREERSHKGIQQTQQNAWNAQKARAHLYGLHHASNLVVHSMQSNPAPLPPPAPVIAQQQSVNMFRSGYPQQQQQQQSFAATSAAATAARMGSGGLFGTMTGAGYGGNDSSRQPSNILAHSAADVKADCEEDAAFDAATLQQQPPSLSFADSQVEETGLTTTYDLPGLKSLPTGPVPSKQRVARISFTAVAFSHTVVAKYKPVAYLKAKLRNGSSLTLLKGPVGLTLDGSFMGRSSLPRCSAGDAFQMSLGVDPAIAVAYPKPDVRRSTSGLFNKEDSSVYTRSVTLTNTRASAGKPTNLVVYDQVPVSEDERLRIVVVSPRGLTVGGGAVASGLPGKAGKDGQEWGRATATLRKGGEVCWDVGLNAGKSVKLVLEYEVAVPGGDSAVQC